MACVCVCLCRLSDNMCISVNTFAFFQTEIKGSSDVRVSVGSSGMGNIPFLVPPADHKLLSASAVLIHIS